MKKPAKSEEFVESSESSDSSIEFDEGQQEEEQREQETPSHASSKSSRSHGCKHHTAPPTPPPSLIKGTKVPEDRPIRVRLAGLDFPRIAPPAPPAPSLGVPRVTQTSKKIKKEPSDLQSPVVALVPTTLEHFENVYSSDWLRKFHEVLEKQESKKYTAALGVNVDEFGEIAGRSERANE